jgi:hypothetical protein
MSKDAVPLFSGESGRWLAIWDKITVPISTVFLNMSDHQDTALTLLI